jgi:hypothetical protein
VRAKLLPLECSDPAFAHHASYDCANPEQDATNLAITKLIIQVDSDKVGGYCPCNVHAGRYSCGGFHHGGSSGGCAGFGAVPVGEFLGRFYNASRYNNNTPDFQWYGVNTLQRFGSGMWYSTVGSAQCGLPNSPSNCSWVRTIASAKRHTFHLSLFPCTPRHGVCRIAATRSRPVM